MTVAYDYAVWQVLTSRTLPESEWEQWERDVWVRHYGSVDPWVYAPWEAVLVPVAGGPRRKIRVRQVGWRDGRLTHFYDTGIWVYEDPEHYPVCSNCHGPVPCRVKHAERVAAVHAEREAAQAEKATKGAMCCGGDITPRQKIITFPGPNIVAPTAPPPIFHARESCRPYVVRYEKVWLKANPGGRSRFFCPGKIRRHVDGWDCTEQADCRGVDVDHWDRTVCDGKGGITRRGERFPCLRCVDARARGDIMPDSTRRRRPRKDRFADPAPLAGWVIPANKDLDRSRAHAVDPEHPGDRLPVVRQWVTVETPSLDGLAGKTTHGSMRRGKFKETIRPAREWPPGASRGRAVCGAQLLADDLWVRYPGGDPEEDGLACPDCLDALAKELA